MKDVNSSHLVLAVKDGDSVATSRRSPQATDGSGAQAFETAAAPGAASPSRSAPCARICDMPRSDVVRYISEMCDALAYMASAQQCNDLANLLHEAAAEAGRCEAGE